MIQITGPQLRNYMVPIAYWIDPRRYLLVFIRCRAQHAKGEPAGARAQNVGRANDIVRKAVGDLYRKYGEKWWWKQEASDLGEKMASAFDGFAAGDALDYEVVRQDSDAFEVNVTGCRYATFYKEIGAPELGFLLICSADFSMAEGYGTEVQLTRTQTIMQGAGHCDFRYMLKKKWESGERSASRHERSPSAGSLAR